MKWVAGKLEAVHQYIFKDVPSTAKISNKLKDTVVRIELFFLESLESFTLLRTLMRCFLKADEAGENRQVAASSLCLQSQWTSCMIRMLFVSEFTWAALRKMKPEQKKGIIMEMIKLYQTATKYLFSIHCYRRLNVGFTLLNELSRCHSSSVKKRSAHWQIDWHSIWHKWSQRASTEEWFRQLSSH